MRNELSVKGWTDAHLPRGLEVLDVDVRAPAAAPSEQVCASSHCRSMIRETGRQRTGTVLVRLTGFLYSVTSLSNKNGHALSHEEEGVHPGSSYALKLVSLTMIVENSPINEQFDRGT